MRNAHIVKKGGENMAKARGAVAPGKVQVNWRIREDVIKELAEEAQALGFASIPALINHILVTRYARKKKI